MRYDRLVIAYHGCDRAVATRLLDGEPFRKSQNDYDWLGEGVYFWEHGHDRAMQFAREQQRRGKVEHPAVVGALLHLGNCFDLMDTRCTEELGGAFAEFRESYAREGMSIPKNDGDTPDRLLRRLDCAVINFYMKKLGEKGAGFDSVRGAFVEGRPAYEGSGIFHKSHIQLSIRNNDCIVGVFRPKEAP